MTLIGIDPGEKHTGIASIEIRGNSSIWRSGTLESDEDYLTPVLLLDDLFPRLYRPITALEDFRVRSVGHQSFNRVLTPRLIGAFEFSLRKHGCEYYFFQPGNIIIDLVKSGMIEILGEWEKKKFDDHARSAWRILTRLILHQLPDFHWLLDVDNTELTSWKHIEPDTSHWTDLNLGPAMVRKKR